MTFDPLDPFDPLETARLQLRCVALGDAAATSALMTPAVSRWVANWPMPFTPEMATTRIEASRRSAFTGDALPFAVVARADGELLGWTWLQRNGTERRRARLGSWLGERHHGKGYMKEVTPVVLAAGFNLLDLDVIEAAALPTNAGSLAVMRASGMKPAREAMVFAPAREREEFCHVYEIERSALPPVTVTRPPFPRIQSFRSV
jgi:ribosomal-protein-alanine N-acetyltransferase